MPDVDGYPMPTVTNESTFYASQGWSYSGLEPSYAADPGFAITGDVDWHGDPEGDDLWQTLMQYLRSGQAGFLSRATEWKRYWLTQGPGIGTWNEDVGFG